MKDFQGMVNGIDVIATPGQPVRCLAFVTQSSANEIQVTTEIHALQTALELASSKKVRVEVSYDETGGEKKLTRVHLLDRDRQLAPLEDSLPAFKAALTAAGAPTNIAEAVLQQGYFVWATDPKGNAIALTFVPKP
jgi:hypothetical protein